MVCGHLAWEAIQAVLELEKDGIQAEVINIHTIKPLDVATIVASARRTGAVLVAEEHQLAEAQESVAQTLPSITQQRWLLLRFMIHLEKAEHRRN